ncbi:MAG TPA: CBS domain-containing protein [Gemmatimonadales bacterium]|jgi:CBS domain-containing protein
MTAGRLCTRVLATASPDETIRAAAQRMAEFDVGALVVLKEDRATRAVGVITDRDIVLRCVAERRNPEHATVSEMMTTPVFTVRDETPIHEALAKMAAAGTRRLVVVAEGERVAGVLTLDDIIGDMAWETSAIGKLLEKQQPTVPAAV